MVPNRVDVLAMTG